MAFDITEDCPMTGRFVIVDDYEICGGGIVREALEDQQTWLRYKVLRRNYKWEKSTITFDERAEKYNQIPSLVILTGQRHCGKKPIAKALEKRLFINKKIVYLGIGCPLWC
jgi:bifunctional enzyme CysN/CysC